jgi:hypothetical protein
MAASVLPRATEKSSGKNGKGFSRAVKASAPFTALAAESITEPQPVHLIGDRQISIVLFTSERIRFAMRVRSAVAL